MLKTHQRRHAVLIMFCLGLGLAGCAASLPEPGAIIWESGRDEVRLNTDLSGARNSHPIAFTPSQVGTLLRGIRAGERRNWIHRLASGEAVKARAFRDDFPLDLVALRLLAIASHDSLLCPGPCADEPIKMCNSQRAFPG